MPPKFLLLFIAVFAAYNIHAQTAAFTADVTSGCAPLTVQFKDQSVGATSWSWDLGNTNSSIIKNPAAIYGPGIYTVSLTINNGASSKTITNFINVFQSPVVDFTSNIISGCAPLSVNFTSLSSAGSGSITNTDWVFGEGGTSTADNPSHVYVATNSTSNIYTVTLAVKNSNGCKNSATKINLITVNNVLPDFSVDNAVSCNAPATVNFTNASQGAGQLTYAWNFGDNTAVSGAVNPPHTYQNSGVYSVSLSAHSNANGCTGTITKSNFISVATSIGTDFQATTLKACVGQTIDFFDISTASEVSRQWIFGNNKTATIINPSTSYATAGTYDVTLKINLTQGCQTSVVKKIQVANDAAPDFTITQQCHQNVTFTNKTSNGYSWLWTFGDGASSTAQDPVHKYAGAGDYYVGLTAYNLFGCSFFIEKKIHVANSPLSFFIPDQQTSCVGASLSGCAPFTIPFTNQSASDISLKSVKWFFGDDTTAEWIAGNSSTNNNYSPSHTYVNAGTYNLVMAITSSIGCVDTLRKNIIVSKTTPLADFKVDKLTACVGENLTFTDQSTNADFWCWDFGDTEFGSGPGIKKSYRHPGIYSVTLTAKNAGCTNVKAKPQLITILDPSVDFTFDKDCANPLQLRLTNNAAKFDSFKWDFGDGNSDTQNLNPQHNYAAAGTYSVSLTVSSVTTGCKPVFSQGITMQDVHADFIVDPSDKICKDVATNFKDASKFAVSWNWDFNDGTQSTHSSFIKSYSTPKIYNVSLKVTDSDGCPDTKIIPVTVADINGKFYFTGVSDCKKLDVQFKDQSTALPPITTWTWDFGDGQPVDNNTNPSHSFTQKKPYTITLTLQNSDAICTLSVDNGVVFTNPEPDFSVIRDTVCINEQVVFYNETKNAQYYDWQLDATVNSKAVSPSNAYSNTGKYDITLKAKDQYGCELSLTKPAYIDVTKPVANFAAFQTSAECPPLITTFNDQSSGVIVGWAWDFGDGQNSSAKNPVNTYIIPGVYDVQLFVTDKSGCTDKYRVNGIVSVGGPYGSYTLNSDSICQNTSASFNATATNTKNYVWDFGDGTVLNSEAASIEHVYTNVADCNLSLVLEDDKGCKVAIGSRKLLTILEQPELDFNYSPQFPFENESVNFNAVYKGELNFAWTFDDQATQTVPSFETSFENYGSHTVILNAINLVGCHNAVSKDLIVLADIVKIPNVFTPNETDNTNSVFEIPGVEKGSWSLMVYNRWGKLVYSDKDYLNQWDGRHLSNAVYYYHLINNVRHDKQYKGYVQIIK